jgi:sugar phosphate permease
MFGAFLMLIGANLRTMVTVDHGNFWPVFFGHIIALCGQAFLRNPVTKLTNNWFGDNERGIATGISIMSGPAGIFISKVLI